MSLPPVELHLTIARLPVVECAGNHPTSPRNVKAVFSPAFCFIHRNNQNPSAGWAYITHVEAEMLTIARRHDWTLDAFEEMLARDLEASIETVEIADSEEAKEE